MDYIDETTKQYQLWAPDLKHIIRSHAVKFAENKKGGSVNLRLQRQKPNTLSEQKLIEQPHKKDLTTLLEHSVSQPFPMPGIDNPPAPAEASTTSEETELTGPDLRVQSVPAERSEEASMSDATALHKPAGSKPKMVKQFL